MSAILIVSNMVVLSFYGDGQERLIDALLSRRTHTMFGLGENHRFAQCTFARLRIVSIR
jgi:hypothetical protein